MSTELTLVKRDLEVVDSKTESSDIEVVDLIRVAVEKGMDIERLLELRERIKKEKAQEEFSKAFSRFQSELPEVIKDKKVLNKDGTIRYQYASLDTILNIIKPFLAKHNLSITFKTQTNNDSITVICIVRHILGHAEETSFTLPIDDSPHISKIQRFGSTLTYARRYALSLALGILSTDEDNDASNEAETVAEMPVHTAQTVQLQNGNSITENQKKKIFVLLKGKTREERLQIVKAILGREIASLNDLTKAEASQVIDVLESGKEPFQSSSSQ